MRDTELNRYKRKLLKMEREGRDDFNRIVDVIIHDAQAAGEHDRGTSESVDKEYAIEQTEEEIRLKIGAALKRIDQGIFGRCEDCGQDIPLQRLDAIPYTPYCVNCEKKHESV